MSAEKPSSESQDFLRDLLDCGKVTVNRGPLLFLLGAVKALRDGPDLDEIAEALFADLVDFT